MNHWEVGRLWLSFCLPRSPLRSIYCLLSFVICPCPGPLVGDFAADRPAFCGGPRNRSRLNVCADGVFAVTFWSDSRQEYAFATRPTAWAFEGESFGKIFFLKTLTRSLFVITLSFVFFISASLQTMLHERLSLFFLELKATFFCKSHVAARADLNQVFFVVVVVR